MPELTQIKLVNGVTYDIADAKCRDNIPKSLIDLKEDAKSVHVTQYEKNKWNGIDEKMPFNFGVNGDKYGYYNSKGELIPFGSSEEQPFKLGIDDEGNYGYIKNGENTVTVFGSSEEQPFKLGIDENGNYGYIKVGADTVTPFKSGSDGGGYTIANGDFEKLFETRVATVSHIIDKNYDEYLMELSLERNSQFILEDSTLAVGNLYSDITCKNGDGNRVVYNYKTGLISLPDGGYGISNGEPVNPRADVAYKWFIVYSHVPNIDHYVDGECYIIRYSNDRSFWFVTSKDKTTLNFWCNEGSGLQWSSTIMSPYATYGNCNVFYREEYSTTSDLAYYVDFVTDDPALNFIQNNLSLFTDEDGNFTMKNPWKVTMYGKTDSKSKKGNIDILGIADYVEEE